jgi:hypothetical protein
VVSSIDRQFQMIVECLDRHTVSYVVIGGIAAMLQDVPIQETLDVDVVPERSARNLKALANALREMEARLRVPGDPDGVEIPLDERTFRDVSTLTFVTRFGPLDVLFEPPGAADSQIFRPALPSWNASGSRSRWRLWTTS